MHDNNRKSKAILEKWSDLETEERVGKWFGVRERCLGRWEVRNYRERSRRNEMKIALTLYIEISFSQCIERYREVLRIKMWEIAIKQLSRSCPEVSTTKSARWIEKLSRRQKLSWWIEEIETFFMDRGAIKKLSRLW